MHTEKGVIKYKFTTANQAIRFFNACNPARQKFKNLLEPENETKHPSEDFSGDTPRDVWASVCKAIQLILTGISFEKKQAFILHHIGEGSNLLAAEDIAEKLKISRSTVYKYLKQTREDLEDELIRRRLLDPEFCK